MKFQPRYKTLSVVLPLLLLAGCSSPPQKLQQREAAVPTPSVAVTRNVQTVAPDEYARTPEVVRYDRYLLVSTDPMAAQRDPLLQIIDIRIPSSLHPTVADALRYTLKQSGYSLCATGPANGVLYRQPLPAVQYQLGPMRLRTALQVMAGPARQLEVDDVQRVVCHSLRDGYQLPASQLPPVRVPQKIPTPATGGFLKKMSEKKITESVPAGEKRRLWSWWSAAGVCLCLMMAAAGFVLYVLVSGVTDRILAFHVWKHRIIQPQPARCYPLFSRRSQRCRPGWPITSSAWPHYRKRLKPGPGPRRNWPLCRHLQRGCNRRSRRWRPG